MEKILHHGEYYGEVKKRVHFPGFVLTETEYSPRSHVPFHSHKHAYFCFVLSGSYKETFDSRSRTCIPFTFAFHPPDEMHSEIFQNAEATCFNVEIDSPYIERVRSYSSVLDAPIELRDTFSAVLAMKLYREFQSSDAFSPLAIEALILDLLADTSRKTDSLKPKAPAWLNQVKDILRARHRKDLSLPQVAQEVGVHPVHLAREFHRCFGCTFGTYIRQLRIEYAWIMLKHRKMSLAELAVSAGFYDQSHFCRVFRKITGITPTQHHNLKVG